MILCPHPFPIHASLVLAFLFIFHYPYSFISTPLHIRTMYEEADRTSATKDDIHTLARETFYLMDNFKHEIINYLKQSH